MKDWQIIGVGVLVLLLVGLFILSKTQCKTICEKNQTIADNAEKYNLLKKQFSTMSGNE